MLRIKLKLSKFKLDKGRWSKALNKALEPVVREAMLEFLEAVLLHVPTYTGMSRGSLRPIGRFVGKEIPISPDEGAKRYPNKTPEAGDSASKFEFVNDGKKVTISFDEGVLHYLINEFHEVDFPFRPGNAGPWHSFKAGREAYQKFIRQNLKKRIPRIVSFISRTQVKVDAEGNTSLRSLGFDV